jgi:hypothetical protein
MLLIMTVLKNMTGTLQPIDENRRVISTKERFDFYLDLAASCMGGWWLSLLASCRHIKILMWVLLLSMANWWWLPSLRSWRTGYLLLIMWLLKTLCSIISSSSFMLLWRRNPTCTVILEFWWVL